jgi:phosphate transport system substrate-binding protein
MAESAARLSTLLPSIRTHGGQGMRDARKLLTALLIFLVSCGGGKTAGDTSSATGITGAGSSFVYPLMSKWAAEYAKVNPGTQVNYQSIGSGAGISQVSVGTVDFGATDGPMSDEQLAASKVGKIIHIPVIMGATVVAYNLPGFTGEMKLTPDILANVYLGKITKWDDPAIKAANPGQRMPSMPIAVMHRADGSGTTFIFTDYLSKVSPEWSSSVGKNTAVAWPTGLGAKGSEGVSGNIRQTPGALGYVEMTYADQNNIPYASIQNSAGSFIRPTPESVTAAAASAQVPDDFRYSITNAPGKDAYPISGTTWLLIPVNPSDKSRGAVVLAFTDWILTAGQQFAPSLHYSALPPAIIERARQLLKQGA